MLYIITFIYRTTWCCVGWKGENFPFLMVCICRKLSFSNEYTFAPTKTKKNQSNNHKSNLCWYDDDGNSHCTRFLPQTKHKMQINTRKHIFNKHVRKSLYNGRHIMHSLFIRTNKAPCLILKIALFFSRRY